MPECHNCILDSLNDPGGGIGGNPCHYPDLRRQSGFISTVPKRSLRRLGGSHLFRQLQITRKFVPAALKESGRSRLWKSYDHGDAAESPGHEYTVPDSREMSSIRKKSRDRQEFPCKHGNRKQMDYPATTRARRKSCDGRMMPEGYEEEFFHTFRTECHADLFYANPSPDAQIFFQDASSRPHYLSSTTKKVPEQTDSFVIVSRSTSQEEFQTHTLSKAHARGLPPASPSWLDNATSLSDSVATHFRDARLKVAPLYQNFSKGVNSHPAPFLERLICRLSTDARVQGHRIFRSLMMVPSPALRKGEDTAVFRWIENLGRNYGGSLMVLVGLGYWIQGLRCFPWLIANFYLKDVFAVDPGTLQVVQNTVNLPMVAKPVYGIVSDAVYIRGAHRVPYLVMGGCLQVLSWGSIAFLPGDGSSVLVVATLLGLSNLGASMVDVANDALVAESAKKKKSTGELQSFAWFSTAAGGVLGNLFAAIALSHVEFRPMFGLFGMLVFFQVVKSVGVDEDSFDLKKPRNKTLGFFQPTERRTELPCMKNGSNLSPITPAAESTEDKWRHSGTNLVMKEISIEEDVAKVPGIGQQFIDLINLVRQPDVLYPLAWFMASYAMIPTLTGIMFFYETQHLKVDPSAIGLAKVLGQVGLMGGSAVYSQYLKDMPLRKLLGAVQVLLCFCMLFDIILVKRINVELGIPDALLVLGGSAFVDAINQFKILPFMVLLAQLCPAGKEGSLLAALMSIQCLATIVSGFLGVTLASLLHISSNDFSELPTGIFVQAMAALLPLLWISFIPEGPKMASVRVSNGKKQRGLG